MPPAKIDRITTRASRRRCSQPVGLVFIGIGGVLFILGMRRRPDDHSGSG
jgi:hypothetical protein